MRQTVGCNEYVFKNVIKGLKGYFWRKIENMHYSGYQRKAELKLNILQAWQGFLNEGQ